MLTAPARVSRLAKPLRLSLAATFSTTATMSQDRVIPLATRMTEGNTHKQDVWSIFTPAAVPKDALNLGQGFMNWAPAQWIRDGLKESLDSDVMVNHYAHPRGRPRLIKAISEHYTPSFPNLVAENRKLAVEEIVVTAGANGGTYAALAAHLEPGDEVICIEPFFDQYYATIAFQGAKPVFVPLHPPKEGSGNASGGDWTLDFAELEAAFTPKTKAIIVNTPHNPVGKVFTRAELEKIAELAIRKNILVIADEVYDCMVYDGKEHVRIASLPGMWERTITVISGGKSFAATGWRVGWLIGDKTLIGATLAAHSRLVFSASGPMQEAIAIAIEGAEEHKFFETQTKEYQERRDILCSYFDKLGLPYTLPEGSYFLLVDMSKVNVPSDFEIPDTCKGRGKDFATCWWLANEIGVVGIPPSEFYSKEHEHIGERFARFAFCKDPAFLHKAGERLLKLKQYM